MLCTMLHVVRIPCFPVVMMVLFVSGVDDVVVDNGSVGASDGAKYFL